MSGARFSAEHDLKILSDGLAHPECVAWFDGSAWCATETGALLRLDPTSGAPTTVAQTDGALLGFTFDAAGTAYLCDAGRGRVLTADADGHVATLVRTVEGRPLNTPNFPAFGPDGRLWVSDSGRRWGSDDGFIAVVNPDGEARVASDACPGWTNGLALSPDGAWLYVVESSRPRVSRLPIDADGLGAPELVLDLPGAVPDGLAFDTQGDLYVGCWRPDRIYRLEAATGRVEILVDDPTGEWLTTPTNICFGGPALDRFLIAGISGHRILELPLGRVGAPVHHPPRG